MMMSWSCQPPALGAESPIVSLPLCGGRRRTGGGWWQEQVVKGHQEAAGGQRGPFTDEGRNAWAQEGEGA